MVGLEIDPDHRPQLQVDEQQQDVIDLDVPLLDHHQELHHRRPGRDPANGEQRQVMERLDEQIAQGLGDLMHVLPQFLGPIDFHGARSLDRLDRMMRVEGDCFTACNPMQKKGQRLP